MWCTFQKSSKKLRESYLNSETALQPEKKVFVSEITAFQLVAVNSPKYEKNICCQLWMC